MCEPMAACLSEIQNDSCFPRTLGSEVEPPSSPYTFDISCENLFMYVGMCIGALTLLVLLYYALRMWLQKNNCRYLTRMNAGMLALALVDKFCWDRALTRRYEMDQYSILLFHYSYLAVVVIGYMKYNFSRPIDITRQFHEVDYMESRAYRKRNYIIRERMRRLYTNMDVKNMPPCYPNGWIPLLESRDLKRGDVVGVSALGYRFAIYRDENIDKLYVIDGLCPHLGADMTVGGVVRGSCLECPFHGWLVDGRTGVFTRGPGRVPCADRARVPSNARVRTWNKREVNGYIYVWFHAEADQQEPTWEMKRVESICDGSWLYRGRTEHIVRCHIQEIPENGADTNHLEQLHSASVFLGLEWMNTDSWWNVIRHHWQPEWSTDEKYAHIAKIKLTQKTTFLGFGSRLFDLDLDIEQIGPATVHLHIKSPHGCGILTQHITPVGPLTMRVVHQLYTEPGFKPFWAHLLLKSEARMLERDIVVWDHKKYLSRPLILGDERSLKKYRGWYTQFYSENSPRIYDLNLALIKELDL